MKRFCIYNKIMLFIKVRKDVRSHKAQKNESHEDVRDLHGVLLVQSTSALRIITSCEISPLSYTSSFISVVSSSTNTTG